MILLFVVAAFCIPPTSGRLDPRNLPEELRALVPQRIRGFYQNISDEESALVEKVLSDDKYWKNANNFLSAVRNDSDAALKILELHVDLGHVWDNLAGPAKDFAEYLENTLIGMAKTETRKDDRRRTLNVAQAIVSKYDSLSRPDRENFNENFPEVALAIDDPAFRAVSSGKPTVSPETRSSCESSQERNRNDSASSKNHSVTRCGRSDIE